MAISYLGGGRTMTPTVRRRPLAPLAVSRPDGSTTAVPAPMQTRVPTGTMFRTPQQLPSSASQLIGRMNTAVRTANSTLAGDAARFTPQGPTAGLARQPTAAQSASMTASAPVTAQPGRPYAAAPQVAPAMQPTGGAPGQFGSQIQDITGEERPQQINPGQSVTNPLQERAQQEAMRALENPSPYDDALFKQEVERAREAFGGDISARGLDYSTIAPTLFAQRVLNPMLSERARGIAEARRSALEGATAVTAQRTGLEQTGREELRGERGYLDTLRERARQNAIDQYGLGESQMQNTLQQLMQQGNPGQAIAALQGAGYGMQGPASQYAQQAEGTGQSLQDLAQLFIQRFYGPQPTPQAA